MRLWKHFPTARVPTTFSGSPKLALYNSIETQYMFSISFRKHHGKKREKLVFFDHHNVNLFAGAIITSTARASSVFPSSYRNTLFNQSARVFS